MLSKNDDLKKITEVLSSYEYLMRLSEDTILDTCYPAVLSDNTITFTDFTQDHRDAYTRLKFRALNKRNAQQHTGLQIMQNL